MDKRDSNLLTKRKCVSLLIDMNVSKKFKKVQVGNDQVKAQSERDSHSKNRGGEKLKS